LKLESTLINFEYKFFFNPEKFKLLEIRIIKIIFFSTIKFYLKVKKNEI
jgi:hypothetical protein